MNQRALPARPIRADDQLVAGYLNPRPIPAWIRVAFGGMSYRLEVRVFHARRFGIRPDPVKA